MSLVLPLLLVSLVRAGSGPVADYASLLSALERGAQVRAVLHYRNCTLPDDGQPVPGPDATGGMTLDVFEAFAAGSVGNPTAFLSSSNTRLILHPHYGQVLNYVKLRVSEDGATLVTARYLDPRRYKVRMEEVFSCRLSTSSQEGGVELFVVE